MNKRSEYRTEASEVAREASWTFWRFLPIGLVIIVVLAVVGFGLRSAGMIGGTIVDRKVFEQSYQRSASLNARIATDEAVMAEIEQQLMNTDLDNNTRQNLRAQLSAARVRISTAKRMQK